MIRPINFNGPEVRAVLDGLKTHHCVILKPQPPVGFFFNGLYYPDLKKLEFLAQFDCNPSVCPPVRVAVPFAPGDKLWVRETWQEFFADELPPDRAAPIAGRMGIPAQPHRKSVIAYLADGAVPPHPEFGKAIWRSPVTMPKWASRLTLTVDAVRVFRVQDITLQECLAEGWPGAEAAKNQGSYRWFMGQWNARHGADAWDRNAWVAGLTFTARHCNVDQ